MRLKTRALHLAAAVLLVLAPIAVLTTPVHAVGVSLSAPDVGLDLGAPELLGLTLAIGMAIKVKDATAVAAKWRQRAGAAAGDYKTGVQQAGGDWESATAASADNYAAGVQQAIGDGRFARGVREAGGAKYVSRAAEIGATRYAPGVQASEGEMAKGVAPVLNTIANLTLPPRQPKGSPANMERANAVAMALRKLKTGGR